jgi:hypothetical protein
MAQRSEPKTAAAAAADKKNAKPNDDWLFGFEKQSEMTTRIVREVASKLRVRQSFTKYYQKKQLLYPGTASCEDRVPLHDVLRKSQIRGTELTVIVSSLEHNPNMWIQSNAAPPPSWLPEDIKYTNSAGRGMPEFSTSESEEHVAHASDGKHAATKETDLQQYPWAMLLFQSVRFLMTCGISPTPDRLQPKSNAAENFSHLVFSVNANEVTIFKELFQKATQQQSLPANVFFKTPNAEHFQKFGMKRVVDLVKAGPSTDGKTSGPLFERFIDEFMATVGYLPYLAAVTSTNESSDSSTFYKTLLKQFFDFKRIWRSVCQPQKPNLFAKRVGRGADPVPTEYDDLDALAVYWHTEFSFLTFQAERFKLKQTVAKKEVAAAIQYYLAQERAKKDGINHTFNVPPEHLASDLDSLREPFTELEQPEGQNRYIWDVRKMLRNYLEGPAMDAVVSHQIADHENLENRVKKTPAYTSNPEYATGYRRSEAAKKLDYRTRERKCLLYIFAFRPGTTIAMVFDEIAQAITKFTNSRGKEIDELLLRNNLFDRFVDRLWICKEWIMQPPHSHEATFATQFVYGSPEGFFFNADNKRELHDEAKYQRIYEVFKSKKQIKREPVTGLVPGQFVCIPQLLVTASFQAVRAAFFEFLGSAVPEEERTEKNFGLGDDPRTIGDIFAIAMIWMTHIARPAMPTFMQTPDYRTDLMRFWYHEKDTSGEKATERLRQAEKKSALLNRKNESNETIKKLLPDDQASVRRWILMGLLERQAIELQNRSSDVGITRTTVVDNNETDFVNQHVVADPHFRYWLHFASTANPKPEDVDLGKWSVSDLRVAYEAQKKTNVVDLILGYGWDHDGVVNVMNTVFLNTKGAIAAQTLLALDCAQKHSFLLDVDGKNYDLTDKPFLELLYRLCHLWLKKIVQPSTADSKGSETNWNQENSQSLKGMTHELLGIMRPPPDPKMPFLCEKMIVVCKQWRDELKQLKFEVDPHRLDRMVQLLMARFQILHLYGAPLHVFQFNESAANEYFKHFETTSTPALESELLLRFHYQRIWMHQFMVQRVKVARAVSSPPTPTLPTEHVTDNAQGKSGSSKSEKRKRRKEKGKPPTDEKTDASSASSDVKTSELKPFDLNKMDPQNLKPFGFDPDAEYVKNFLKSQTYTDFVTSITKAETANFIPTAEKDKSVDFNTNRQAKWLVNAYTLHWKNLYDHLTTQMTAALNPSAQASSSTSTGFFAGVTDKAKKAAKTVASVVKTFEVLISAENIRKLFFSRQAQIMLWQLDEKATPLQREFTNLISVGNMSTLGFTAADDILFVNLHGTQVFKDFSTFLTTFKDKFEHAKNAAAEAARKKAENDAAEAKRNADAAEAKSKADKIAADEAKKKADEATAKLAVDAEAKRKADAAAAAAAATAATATTTLAKDKVNAEEAKKKAAEAAAKLANDSAAAAEAKRKADEAEAKTKALLATSIVEAKTAAEKEEKIAREAAGATEDAEKLAIEATLRATRAGDKKEATTEAEIASEAANTAAAQAFIAKTAATKAHSQFEIAEKAARQLVNNLDAQKNFADIRNSRGNAHDFSEKATTYATEARKKANEATTIAAAKPAPAPAKVAVPPPTPTPATAVVVPAKAAAPPPTPAPTTAVVVPAKAAVPTPTPAGPTPAKVVIPAGPVVPKSSSESKSFNAFDQHFAHHEQERQRLTKYTPWLQLWNEFANIRFPWYSIVNDQQTIDLYTDNDSKKQFPIVYSNRNGSWKDDALFEREETIKAIPAKKARGGKPATAPVPERKKIVTYRSNTGQYLPMAELMADFCTLLTQLERVENSGIQISIIQELFGDFTWRVLGRPATTKDGEPKNNGAFEWYLATDEKPDEKLPKGHKDGGSVSWDNLQKLFAVSFATKFSGRPIYSIDGEPIYSDDGDQLTRKSKEGYENILAGWVLLTSTDPLDLFQLVRDLYQRATEMNKEEQRQLVKEWKMKYLSAKSWDKFKNGDFGSFGNETKKSPVTEGKVTVDASSLVTTLTPVAQEHMMKILFWTVPRSSPERTWTDRCEKLVSDRMIETALRSWKYDDLAKDYASFKDEEPKQSVKHFYSFAAHIEQLNILAVANASVAAAPTSGPGRNRMLDDSMPAEDEDLRWTETNTAKQDAIETAALLQLFPINSRQREAGTDMSYDSSKDRIHRHLLQNVTRVHATTLAIPTETPWWWTRKHQVTSILSTGEQRIETYSNLELCNAYDSYRSGRDIDTRRFIVPAESRLVPKAIVTWFDHSSTKFRGNLIAYMPGSNVVFCQETSKSSTLILADRKESQHGNEARKEDDEAPLGRFHAVHLAMIIHIRPPDAMLRADLSRLPYTFIGADGLSPSIQKFFSDKIQTNVLFDILAEMIESMFAGLGTLSSSSSMADEKHQQHKKRSFKKTDDVFELLPLARDVIEYDPRAFNPEHMFKHAKQVWQEDAIDPDQNILVLASSLRNLTEERMLDFLRPEWLENATTSLQPRVIIPPEELKLFQSTTDNIHRFLVHRWAPFASSNLTLRSTQGDERSDADSPQSVDLSTKRNCFLVDRVPSKWSFFRSNHSPQFRLGPTDGGAGAILNVWYPWAARPTILQVQIHKPFQFSLAEDMEESDGTTTTKQKVFAHYKVVRVLRIFEYGNNDVKEISAATSTMPPTTPDVDLVFLDWSHEADIIKSFRQYIPGEPILPNLLAPRSSGDAALRPGDVGWINLLMIQDWIVNADRPNDFKPQTPLLKHMLKEADNYFGNAVALWLAYHGTQELIKHPNDFAFEY